MKPRIIGIAGLLAAAVFLVFDPTQGQKGPSEAEAAVWQGHEKGVTDVAFLPGGEEAVSCSLDGTVRLWKVRTGRMEKVLSAAKDELFALSVSRDGRKVVTCGYSGRIGVLSPDGGPARYLGGIKGWSVDVCLSPDSRFAAVWSMNGDVQLLDLVNMKPDRALKGRANKWGLALAWSPDGLRLAAARSTVTLFDIKTGVETLTLDGHADFIRSAAFSPDGLRLSTASMDKSIKVWELESGKTLFTLEPSGLAVFTESGPQIAPVRLPMTAAAFSPDGSRLATAGADRVIRLWNVSDGKAIKEFIGHRMTVTAVEFSPDGRRLVSASLDHTLRLWELD